jgi:acetoin utilization deacetylase AcuC-like enzyme
MMDIAKASCGGKVVITLEGGYDLNGLRNSVKAVLKELAGLSETHSENIVSDGQRDILDRMVQQVSQVHGRYWKNLGL